MQINNYNLIVIAEVVKDTKKNKLLIALFLCCVFKLVSL